MTHYFYSPPVLATLAVRDLLPAARWYHDTLGFRVVLEMKQNEEMPDLVHLRRAQYQDLLLVPAFTGIFTEPMEPGGGVRLTFKVEEDIDELAAHAAEAGAEIVEGPVDRPWNAREVTVQDPDGYRITFSRFSWVSGIA